MEGMRLESNDCVEHPYPINSVIILGDDDLLEAIPTYCLDNVYTVVSVPLFVYNVNLYEQFVMYDQFEYVKVKSNNRRTYRAFLKNCVSNEKLWDIVSLFESVGGIVEIFSGKYFAVDSYSEHHGTQNIEPVLNELFGKGDIEYEIASDV